MSLLSRLAVQAARAYGILSSKVGVSASVLLVAGGGSGGAGSGGHGCGGGGGAGEYYTSSSVPLDILTTYTITVGAGGAGVAGPGGTGDGANGNNGSNSVLSGTGLTTYTVKGGGFGSGAHVNPNGGSGGSGGGAGGSVAGNGIGGSASPFIGQGFAGGSATTTYDSKGGGGAGATTTTPTGGVGLSNSITGSAVFYSGGGGGAINVGAGGAGGNGGGGAGGTSGAAGTAGTANTGGGGGGGGNAGAGAASGSGGSGIVIISYTSATPKFVGGTITTSGGKQIHTFTSSGTLSPITPITASYLVVAGGGGGGTPNSSIYYAGGGGGGGLLTSSTTLYSGATYVVTVGAGGAVNTNGSDSIVSGTGLTTLTSTGGGKGGAFQTNGTAGGSGGGAGGDGSGVARTGGTGSSGQGNNGGGGGAAFGSTNTGAGGGGGAGAAGTTSSTKNGAAGGAGLANSLSGSSVTYAAGGGGQRGSDGTDGTDGANGTGWVSAPNLGHGGAASVQRAGSSGIVIISYAGSQAFNGGLVTTSGGNTIHTFTSTGALTPLTNNLNNSLRFRSSASAYLSRTPASSGNRQKWTYSIWLKKGSIGTEQAIWQAGTAAFGDSRFYFATSGAITWEVYNGSTGAGSATTSALYRDFSAWYHVVISVDTTQATSSNRIKLYVNGEQVTSFSSSSYPAQNDNLDGFNLASAAHYIGSNKGSGRFYDGYMTDINFIDGQQLEPYYFGNNDANGVWKPIQYKGTYGTNGFYLTFGNTTSTTTLGYDSSPNGNNWTCNNISLTAGSTYDAMTDVPTNTSATAANYATLNPNAKASSITLSEGNLKSVDASGSFTVAVFATQTVFDKCYWEFQITNVGANAARGTCGVLPSNYTPTTFANDTLVAGITALGANSVGMCPQVSAIYQNGATTGISTGNWVANDVVMIAYDNGKLWMGRNGTWANSGDPAAGTGQVASGLDTSAMPVICNRNSQTWIANFGQRPFAYTPPSGFVGFNTYNLPTPTILQGNKYMDATLYTGTGTTQVVVNQGQFKPDFVWVKGRSGATDHAWYDSVRGTTKQLESNTQTAETTESTGLTAFGTNGFTVGALAQMNTSAATYVGWQWQAGQGSTSSGTGTGGITSVTQSVNTTAGFSIVTYTGSGSNGTVTHGLGVAPKMIIVRIRNGTTNNWRVYNSSLTSASYFLYLNGTQAEGSDSTLWNSTAPTSSVFSLGTNSDVNASTYNYVAYCWAEIAGFSKFGSYTGNGSTDGPFVYTGFRPKFILAKRTDTAGFDWIMTDSSRSPSNVVDKRLFGNTNDAESSATTPYDYLSNGFKLRNTNTNENASGATYIYMAFAEVPFKISNSR